MAAPPSQVGRQSSGANDAPRKECDSHPPATTISLENANVSSGGTLNANSGSTGTLSISPGSTATAQGTGAIATINSGGNAFLNHRPGAGAAVTTLNLYPTGVADFSQNPANVTVATLNHHKGGTLTASMMGKKVMLTDEKGGIATVTIPNVYQSNGVIHVIDTVEMPN